MLNPVRALSQDSATLRELLFRHNNDYGFLTDAVKRFAYKTVPSLSIIIPYFNVGGAVSETLNRLYRGISVVNRKHSEFRFEVILLDDGSVQRPADKYFEPRRWKNLRLLKSQTNNGRVRTRNEGLSDSKMNKCLFLDADVLVDHSLILNALRLHVLNDRRNIQPCISVGFFRWDKGRGGRRQKHNSRTSAQDFRLECTYRRDWVGTESDLCFVGKKFNLVKDTNGFRTWKGMYGPWCLANMVLGGFFIVDREQSLDVNGFDSMFDGYGFTETSLPTKLIAIKENFVIPQTVGRALHLERNPAHLNQWERNARFREKHALYFRRYLDLTSADARSRPMQTWQG
jgi:glycosyltransferase involved in cell wall biosynthesis